LGRPIEGIVKRNDVVAKLAALEALDRRLELFGAKAHRYKLNPVATESAVAALEARFRFALPADYRTFVTTVGNGGAGPYLGIYPLGFEHSPRALAEWDSLLLGDLSQPFPHRTAWNMPDDFWAERPDPPKDMPLEEEDRLNEVWDARLESVYWRRDLVNGAIPIADIGCASRVILVVTGPEAGTLWEDRRADEAGIQPLTDASGAHVGFSRWYLDWIHAGISKCGGNPDAVPVPGRSWWQRMFGRMKERHLDSTENQKPRGSEGQ
jgi:hypothetical protein